MKINRNMLMILLFQSIIPGIFAQESNDQNSTLANAEAIQSPALTQITESNPTDSAILPLEDDDTNDSSSDHTIESQVEQEDVAINDFKTEQILENQALSNDTDIPNSGGSEQENLNLPINETRSGPNILEQNGLPVNMKIETSTSFEQTTLSSGSSAGSDADGVVSPVENVPNQNMNSTTEQPILSNTDLQAQSIEPLGNVNTLQVIPEQNNHTVGDPKVSSQVQSSDGGIDPLNNVPDLITNVKAEIESLNDGSQQNVDKSLLGTEENPEYTDQPRFGGNPSPPQGVNGEPNDEKTNSTQTIAISSGILAAILVVGIVGIVLYKKRKKASDTFQNDDVFSSYSLSDISDTHSIISSSDSMPEISFKNPFYRNAIDF